MHMILDSLMYVPSLYVLPQYHISEQEIEVSFDFNVDINVSSVSLVDPSLTDAADTTEQALDSYVSACKCDNMTSFTCNTDPLAPNEVLNVCIWSVSTDVEIATLNSLKLFQGDAQNNKTQVIVDGLSIATQFSSMATKSVTERFVSTVVPSRFQSGGTLSVLGLCNVNFVGSARRQLQQAVFERPEYEYEEGVKKTEAKFELPVSLTMPLLEATEADRSPQVPNSKLVFHDIMESAGAGMYAGVAHFFGAIILALFW
mgnify:CR=1 FL=1